MTLRFTVGALLATLVASTASAQHQAVVAKRIAEIKRAYPCADSATIRITAADRGAATNKRTAKVGCWLVGLGLHELAIGHAEQFGIARADTALVTAALLHEFRFKGYRGAPDEWYWIVTLTIAGKPRTLDVYIQELDSSVKVVPTEIVSDHQ